MSKKKTILCIVLLVVTMIIATILSIYLSTDRKPQTESATPILQEAMDTEELDLALQDIATAEENEPVSYEYRVYLTNPYDLYISSLPSHGFGTFEGYLSRYIDYYLPGDELYGVEFIVGTDDFHTIATDFLVKIPDLDVTIKCIYKTSEKRYIFKSPLDGSE